MEENICKFCKALVFTIYTELLKLNNKKNNPVKNNQIVGNYQI